MVNITRYSPLDGAFDDLFRGFLMRPVRFEEQPEVQIKMDVSEDEKAYTVHAEIPGVKKEDNFMSPLKATRLPSVLKSKTKRK